jgi:hypothetical protein
LRTGTGTDAGNGGGGGGAGSDTIGSPDPGMDETGIGIGIGVGIVFCAPDTPTHDARSNPATPLIFLIIEFLLIADLYLPESSRQTSRIRECYLNSHGSFYHPRDQGSGIRDQGSGIRDQGSGIRDQGSDKVAPSAGE